MKKAIFAGMILALLSAFAFAQEAKPEAPQPKTLTPEQVQRLALAEKDFTIAQAQLRQAQLVLDNLTANFALELGVDIKTYVLKLDVINPQLGQIGFLPKPVPPEPEKPEAKKPDAPKPEKEQK